MKAAPKRASDLDDLQARIARAMAQIKTPSSRKGRVASPPVRAAGPAQKAVAPAMEPRPRLGRPANQTAPPIDCLPTPEAAVPVDAPARRGPGRPKKQHIAPPAEGAAGLADTIAVIRELHRERQDYHNAEKRMTLQIKSIQRRVHARTCDKETHAKCAGVYDVMPAAAGVLELMRSDLKGYRLIPEKEMKRRVTFTPVWEWFGSIRGCAELGLAQIIAEAGDLSKYPWPAKLWTRMGLGLYKRTDGTWERQRKATGEDGILAQYRPSRRSIMYIIGDSIIKAASGPYRDIYDERKKYEATKPGCRKPFTEGMCLNEETGSCRDGHIHNRAKRYMEKRLLRDLWRQWHLVTTGAVPESPWEVRVREGREAKAQERAENAEPKTDAVEA